MLTTPPAPTAAFHAPPLQLELPKNTLGTKTAVLNIPLTKDGSSNCDQLVMDKYDFGPPPAPLEEAEVLPENWCALMLAALVCVQACLLLQLRPSAA